MHCHTPFFVDCQCVYNIRGYLLDLLFDAVWLWLFIVFALSVEIVGWFCFLLDYGCFLVLLLMLLVICFSLMNVLKMCWWCHTIGSMEAMLRRRQAKRRKRRKRNGKNERKKRGSYIQWFSLGFSCGVHTFDLFLTKILAGVWSMRLHKSWYE